MTSSMASLLSSSSTSSRNCINQTRPLLLNALCTGRRITYHTHERCLLRCPFTDDKDEDSNNYSINVTNVSMTKNETHNQHQHGHEYYHQQQIIESRRSSWSSSSLASLSSPSSRRTLSPPSSIIQFINNNNNNIYTRQYSTGNFKRAHSSSSSSCGADGGGRARHRSNSGVAGSTLSRTTTTASSIFTTQSRSSNSNSKSRKKFRHVPEPVWSLQDLQLTTKHPPLQDEELDRLARLALIDVNNQKLTATESSGSCHDDGDDDSDSRKLDPSQSSHRRKLKQDVANMMHMIQLVTEYDDTKKLEAHRSHDENGFSDDTGYIYDVVRGGAALMSSSTSKEAMPTVLRGRPDEDPLQEQDGQQAQSVWNHLLKPKTVRKGGGHDYFAIKTTD